MPIRKSSISGTPKGTTADRPASPAVGDVFNNGTLGVEEIYTSVGWVTKNAAPAAPIMGTATNVGTNIAYNNGTATISFTPGSGSGGLAGSYALVSSPGGLTATGATSPITITGLTPATLYTFSLSATNGFGTTNAAFASNSITATTLPQAPTIGTATATGTSGQISLTFTAGANGGSSITNYSYSTDGTNYTSLSPAQTSSPLTIGGLTNNQAITIRIKAINANGSSIASSASNSVTPVAPKATGGTITFENNAFLHTFTGNATFTPSSNFSADILMVGAGGGGGNGGGGGGGGGFVRLLSSQSLTSGTGYGITIGSGGSGGLNNSTQNATIGNTTSAFSQNCVGGGPGGGYQSGAPTGGTFANGGGGGNGQSGGNGPSSIGNAGTVTIGGLTVNGFAGGAYNTYNGSVDGTMAGHGGGGARQDGFKSTGNYGVNTNGATFFPGAGGNGFQWTTALGGNNNYYAGGGSGGHASGSNGAAGGLGGGGNSGSTGVTYSNGDSRYNGTANTGGGGSGNPHTQGGNGGSGVVIVRYAA